MSLSIDLENATNKSADNFTCLLMQLMLKSDASNFKKLASVYPVEANMVWLYKYSCIYVDKSNVLPDFEKIEEKAKELYERPI